MKRRTGTYSTNRFGDEDVRAFVPHRLPPARPALAIADSLASLHADAMAAISRLEVAGAMVPSHEWFLYGFVRKEALISSQIEGTQATLEDVVVFEVTRKSERPADTEEVCNCVAALSYACEQLRLPNGLPVCVRLLCEVHRKLMKGVRGKEKQPGTIRTSQNWIGGSRPGNAKFVPAPPDRVPELLADLEKWIHGVDRLPPLVRAGMAHVQFETIHPFLDGNGRVGRLLITLLLIHWKLASQPLLYLSLEFRKRRQEYYERLNAVRTQGDWEGWTSFFLECVRDSADDGVTAARRLFGVVGKDRDTVLRHTAATLSAVQLLDLLPQHPIVTLATAMKLIGASQPTAGKAIDALSQCGVLHEITGRKRDRVYSYKAYLDVLSEQTDFQGE